MRDWEEVAEELHVALMNQDVVIDEQRRKIKELKEEIKETERFYKQCLKDMKEHYEQILDDVPR